MTSAAMSIGGTVSGYLGQALAQDRGYQQAFLILGFMSCVPAFVYLITMPETLNGGSGGTKSASMAVLEEEDDHDVSEERRTVV